MLSAVKVVGQVLRHRSAVVPIQYRSVEVKPARDQTTEQLPVMNSVAQVCAYLYMQLQTSLLYYAYRQYQLMSSPISKFSITLLFSNITLSSKVIFLISFQNHRKSKDEN